MQVFLEIVSAGEWDEKIFEFIIHGRLKSGQLLYLYDDTADFDLRDYENQLIELLIVAHNVSLKTTPWKPDTQLKDRFLKVIKGKYLGKYNLPQEWENVKYFYDEKSYKYWYRIDLYAIQTEDGIFLIHPKNAEKLSIEDNKEYYFYVKKLYIIAWHPIE